MSPCLVLLCRRYRKSVLLVSLSLSLRVPRDSSCYRRSGCMSQTAVVEGWRPAGKVRFGRLLDQTRCTVQSSWALDGATIVSAGGRDKGEKTEMEEGEAEERDMTPFCFLSRGPVSEWMVTTGALQRISNHQGSEAPQHRSRLQSAPRRSSPVTPTGAAPTS